MRGCVFMWRALTRVCLCALYSSHVVLGAVLRAAGAGWGDLFSGLSEQATEDIHVALPLTRAGPGFFFAEVQLGKAPARLVVDTGSGMMWSRTLSGQEQHPGGSNASDASAFSVQYGRGKVQGLVQRQQVALPSLKKTRTCDVGLATDEGDFWGKQHDIDGVMGLACGDTVASVSCCPPSCYRIDLSTYRRVVRLNNFCGQFLPKVSAENCSGARVVHAELARRN
eukprot:TRINITY_DN29620_c0_g1_i1.p1 TRINITY_DN29620_c0_g1~~TRINITY_DN29620_c0_g1_i1.p1  ORF type:complete len:225 (-),score=27.14 TRINITY_DN29620_c0_g1_i1:101-775(-)